jgi:phosphoglycolate phosphatase
MKCKLVIFDLDGTLMDTSSGIFKSANNTMTRLGKEPETDLRQLAKFIGPPIVHCFKRTFGLADELMEEAVKIFRDEYDNHGQYDAVAYPRMKETLAWLKDSGYLLAVGTLKHEELANNMMRYFGFAPYFSSIRGSDLASRLSKADVLGNVLSDLDLDPSDAILVGDTENDLEGARQAGVRFVAVDYGFGFPRGQQKEDGMAAVISEPKELLTLLS